MLSPKKSRDAQHSPINTSQIYVQGEEKALLDPLAGDDDNENHANLTKMERFKRWLAVMGPGLVVMLADTDAGCIITAGQTGSQWAYSLIPLQLSLIPVVFMAQELTCRIAVVSGKGQTELIKEHFGKGWAYFAVICILITCIGGVISEISGIVGVGQIVNIPDWVSVVICVAFLLAVVFTGSYARVEKIAMGVGMFELVFLVTMFMTIPSPANFQRGLAPLNKMMTPDFLFMAAANVGAVVMPWMVFYQGSASIGKGLKPKDLYYSRIDTFVGACITQLIMTAVIITTAKTWDGNFPGKDDLQTVPQFADKLGDILGPFAGKFLFALGVIGGALIGAIVVALTATWSYSELIDAKRSLETSPCSAPYFYSAYVAILLGSVVFFAIFSGDLITLNVFIQIVNAVLCPIVLMFLFLLACRLPGEHKLQGWYKWVVAIVFSIVSAFGVFSSFYGIFNGAL